VTGFYLCLLCELAGRPAGERFKAPADAGGRALMEQLVVELHPAECRVGVSDAAREPVDVALTDGGDR
jgi:hypothetical protein